MTPSRLQCGAVLYVRPEDVPQDLDRGYYAVVSNVFSTTAVAEPIGEHDIPAHSLALQVALLRQVPAEEPTGTRISALLRQAVAVAVDGRVRFGQVIDTNDLGIQVNFTRGPRWMSREDHLVCAVHPLLAFVLGGWAGPDDTCTEAHTQDAERRLLELIAENSRATPPTRLELLQYLGVPIVNDEMPSEFDQWQEASSGQIHASSTEHAINFSFYIDSSRAVPLALRRRIGRSIGAQPVLDQDTQAQEAGREDDADLAEGPPPKRQRHLSSYLASETSYDEEQKGEEPTDSAHDTEEAFLDSLVAGIPAVQSARLDEQVSVERAPALRMRASNAPLPRQSSLRMHATMTTNPTQNHDGVAALPRQVHFGSTQAAAALAELTAENPRARELIQILTTAAAANQGSDRLRRNRTAFNPYDAQLTAHNGLVHPAFAGTSPSALVHGQLSCTAIVFSPYPSVLMLLFEFAFGPRGLSIMHLARVTMLERIKRQRDNEINMSDFSSSAKLPPAASPKSWAEVHDAVNIFAAYCDKYTDATTARLARTVAGFLVTMQTQGMWPEAHLDILVFWINERLGEYRDLVVAEVTAGVGNRLAALAWFSPTSPSLCTLRTLVLQQDLEEVQTAAAAAKTVHHSNLPPSGRQLPARGLPAHIASLIPKKDGRELCLRFASKKGCRVSGESCGTGARARAHFICGLPKEVRTLLVERYGGVSTEFAK